MYLFIHSSIPIVVTRSCIQKYNAWEQYSSVSWGKECSEWLKNRRHLWQKIFYFLPEYFYFLHEEGHTGSQAGPHNDVETLTSPESVWLPSAAISQDCHTKVALMVLCQSSNKRSECNTFWTVWQLRSHRWETSVSLLGPYLVRLETQFMVKALVLVTQTVAQPGCVMHSTRKSPTPW